MRVRSGRFMQSFIHTLTGYTQNAHKTGILGLRRTRLTRSGFCRISSRPVLRPASHVRSFMFSHSREALKHYYDLC